MKEIIIVDRFESKYALCEKEDRTIISILKSKLPKDIKCGDYLWADLEKECFFIDETLTEQAKKRAIELTKSVFEE